MYPSLTGVNCVKRVVTELAVLDVTPKGFKLVERAPGVSVEDIIKATEADLIIEGEIPEMQLNIIKLAHSKVFYCI
jgi:3-oxoacid CoA-transferase subunit B